MIIYCALFFCHKGLFEWLKSAELRSTEEFMVGTDLESVKEQLCDLKVGSHTFSEKIGMSVSYFFLFYQRDSSPQNENSLYLLTLMPMEGPVMFFSPQNTASVSH